MEKKQINIRLDIDIYEKLKDIAVRERTTITTIIKNIVKKDILKEMKK